MSLQRTAQPTMVTAIIRMTDDALIYDEKSKFSIHIVCVFWSDQILSFVVSRRVEPSFMDYDIGLVPLSRIGGIIDRCPKQICKLIWCVCRKTQREKLLWGCTWITENVQNQSIDHELQRAEKSEENRKMDET